MCSLNVHLQSSLLPGHQRSSVEMGKSPQKEQSYSAILKMHFEIRLVLCFVLFRFVLIIFFYRPYYFMTFYFLNQNMNQKICSMVSCFTAKSISIIMFTVIKCHSGKKKKNQSILEERLSVRQCSVSFIFIYSLLRFVWTKYWSYF